MKKREHIEYSNKEKLTNDKILKEDLYEQAYGTNCKSFYLEKIKDMQYGENKCQKAELYKSDLMLDYEVIDNQELSFNNIIGMTVVMDIVSEFYDVNAVAIVRHAKLCGASLGKTIYDAYTKAFDCDPLSSYNGTIGFSKIVDVDVAKHVSSMSVKLIIAPDFEPEALNILKETEGLKIVKLNTPLADYKDYLVEDIVITPFGTLVQNKNCSVLDKDLFKVVTKTKPTAEQIEDAVFAWNLVKHAKTNAAVIAKDFKMLAAGQGYTNTLFAIERALDYACDDAKDAVLATDDVLFAEECIYAAAQGRISLIIQPGGSLKDNSLIEIANKYNIAMITTGIKNLKL